MPSATAQLEQRLGALQIEVRKLGSERHTLRARLRRDADRRSELESALGAEKELRRHAAEEHQAALAELRARFAELEASREVQAARWAAEFARLNEELARLNEELARARDEAAAAAAAGQATLPTPSAQAGAAIGAIGGARADKAPQGLRRIRGIGPAYERALQQLGVSQIAQIAVWTEHDARRYAKILKIRPERITKDDWIGQARELEQARAAERRDSDAIVVPE